MDFLTITLVITALVIALVISYLQYFVQSNKIKDLYLLFFLRSISIFALLVLLINPKFQKKSFETIKPKLLVAIDNSSSISYAKKDSVVRLLVNNIKDNEAINNRFEVEYFIFGTSTKSGSDPSFDENKTDINEVLGQLNTISKDFIAPIVLISDGNRTYGNDYRYFRSKQEVYPFTIGDTIVYPDLMIDQVNINSYSFLNNQFPVEVFLHYNGNDNIQSNFIVENQNKIIFKQAINFSSNKKSVHLEFKLSADKIGKHMYKAEIKPFDTEKNVLNNIKNFSVHIIDEQSTIAIVYDVLHPDIGMLKKSIESNEQRKVELINVNDLNSIEIDHNAYILYQPNVKFQNIVDHIENNNFNYFLITGRSTNWNFINQNIKGFKKITTSQTEKYYPDYNSNFNAFRTEDIGFAEFPPLEGYFGLMKFSMQYESILHQFINGVTNETPLLITFNNSNKRGAALFGENMWKWRSQVFVSDKSFQRFDNFLGSIIQYLTIAKESNKTELEFKSFYYSDEDVIIKARDYDSNFNFNVNSQMHVNLENSEDKIPFYMDKDYFEVNLGSLKSGNYKFSVVNDQDKSKVEGNFSVIEYSVEQENTIANSSDLSELANVSGGKIFYPSQFVNFLDHLRNNNKFTSVQKEKINTVSLIDWKWLLGIIIVSLSLEWFVRKFRGLV